MTDDQPSIFSTPDRSGAPKAQTDSLPPPPSSSCCCLPSRSSSGRPKSNSELSEDLLASTRSSYEDRDGTLASQHSKPIPLEFDKPGVWRGSNFPLTLLVVGSVISLAASLGATPLINYIINSQVKGEVVVSSYDSPSYDAWASNTGTNGMPIFYDIYIFDVSNYEQVLQNGAKPSLTQRGPYTYRETFTRHEVTFSEDGNEVSFYEQWKYNFDSAASYPLHDSDQVVQANLVAMGLKEMVDALDLDTKIKPNIDTIVDRLIPVHDKPAIDKLKNETERVLLKQVLHTALDNTAIGPLVTKLAICLTSGTEGLSLGPFHRKSVKDLYFGYNDDEMLSTIKSLLPLDMAKTFSTYAPGLSNNYTSKEDVMRRDNIMVTYTGKDDITKLGKFKYYANMTHQYVCLDYTAVCDWVQVQEFDLDGGEIPVCYKFQADWNETEIACHGYSLMFQGEEANVIDGTDASQTGEIPFDEDYFQVFISDLYRSSKLKYFGDVTDWNDITLRRYGIDPADLLNSEHDPGQANFYQFGYDGLENMTNAAGFPLFASKPHFLDGDPNLIMPLVGISPNPLNHDTFVDVEPITGVAFRVAKRLQLNTLLTNWFLPEWKDITIKEVVQRHTDNDVSGVFDCLAANSSWDVAGETFLPYAWADEHYTYSQEDADDFNDMIYGTQELANSVSFWAAVVGTAMFVGSAAMFVYRKRVRTEYRETLEGLSLVSKGGDEEGSWGREERSGTVTF